MMVQMCANFFKKSTVLACVAQSRFFHRNIINFRCLDNFSDFSPIFLPINYQLPISFWSRPIIDFLAIFLSKKPKFCSLSITNFSYAVEWLVEGLEILDGSPWS